MIVRASKLQVALHNAPPFPPVEKWLATVQNVPIFLELHRFALNYLCTTSRQLVNYDRRRRCNLLALCYPHWFDYETNRSCITFWSSLLLIIIKVKQNIIKTGCTMNSSLTLVKIVLSNIPNVLISFLIKRHCPFERSRAQSVKTTKSYCIKRAGRIGVVARTTCIIPPCTGAHVRQMFRALFSNVLLRPPPPPATPLRTASHWPLFVAPDNTADFVFDLFQPCLQRA